MSSKTGWNEGKMRDAKNNSSADRLRRFLLERGVPESKLSDAIADCERVAMRARLRAKSEIVERSTRRPSWAARSGKLRELNAPTFLRAVYADLIDTDGRLLDEEVVRISDPRLVQAVQQYLCKRKSRSQDAGDAAGLVFAPNKNGHGGRRRRRPRPLRHGRLAKQATR